MKKKTPGQVLVSDAIDKLLWAQGLLDESAAPESIDFPRLVETIKGALELRLKERENDGQHARRQRHPVDHRPPPGTRPAGW